MKQAAPEIVKRLCRAITEIVPCDQICVARLPENGAPVEYLTVHPAEEYGRTWSVPMEGSCAAQVGRKRRAELCPVIGTEFRFAEEKALYAQGIREAAFLPLALEGTAPSLMIVGSREPGCLDSRGLRVLERAGGLMAAAMIVTKEGAADHPSGLARVIDAYGKASAGIVQEGDLQAVCRIFLETLRDQSGFRRAALTLVDEEGRDHQWFFTGFTDEEIDRFHSRKMTPASRMALFKEGFRHGSLYVIPTSSRTDLPWLRPGPEGGDAAGGPGLVVIPLRGAGAALLGTVMLDEPVDSAGLQTERLACLDLFAGQMAHSIEKKRLERAVSKAQARLRTAQEQLMQAEKMSAIGQLISGVTHELNNPLSGIMGFAQLLLASEVNPKTKKSLERIFNETVRCQKIVQNLLGFARRHKPEKTCQSLNQVIDSVLELRAYQMQVDNIEVERRYDPVLPSTMLDFHQIQQVVLNVVNNAHQAMMSTSGRPRCLVVTTLRDGDMLRAQFADSGLGIAQERVGRIFEPFFTTKEPGKGTGLGLSLSRAIVTDHQGTMGADSTLAEGTTITIDLPLIESKQAAAEPPEDRKMPGVTLGPLRLLVVDDEEVLTELLGDFLESEGHTVGRARNGRIALQMAKDNDYDAILTDLKMPGLDGQGLYEQVCRIKPDMRSRFIFSTGDLANAKVQTFFQSHGCLYLSKPFKLESVLTTIESMIRRQKAA